MSRQSFSNETIIKIGERIRTVRGTRTQQQFAEELGIDRATLANYEKGRRTPNYKILKKISDISGIGVPTLVFGEETRTPFQIFQEQIHKKLTRLSGENPGYIPRWSISDDEIALIYCYRIANRSLDEDPLHYVGKVVELAEAVMKEDPIFWGVPVMYGEEHIERLRAALDREKLNEGYDPDYELYAMLWSGVPKIGPQ